MEEEVRAFLQQLHSHLLSPLHFAELQQFAKVDTIKLKNSKMNWM